MSSMIWSPAEWNFQAIQSNARAIYAAAKSSLIVYIAPCVLSYASETIITNFDLSSSLLEVGDQIVSVLLLLETTECHLRSWDVLLWVLLKMLVVALKR